jgi:soluble lytic murein transglycosylase-like protein
MAQALKTAQQAHLTANDAVNQAADRVVGCLYVVGRDVFDGFMSMSRFIVTFVGCVTMLGAAAIFSNDTARARFVEHAPSLVGHWLVPAAPAPVAAAGADEQAGAAQPASLEAALEPEQRHVTQYLARRYRVADEAVGRLVAAAYRAGETQALDPLLILAVMAVESSMNPFAQSSVGAQGLMQVMTRVHTDKFEAHGGDHAALDPIANIHVGSAILKDLVRRGGSVERGLQLYVGAGNLPDDGGYGSRVLAERARIQLAATGKVSGALSAGLRADASRITAPAAASETGGVAPVSGAMPQAGGTNDRPA